MTEIFSSWHISSAKKSLKFQRIAAIILLVLYVAFITLVFIFQTRETQYIYMTICIAVSVLLFGFLFFMFSIKYRLTKSYVKMHLDMQKGLTSRDVGTFISFDDEIIQKDGVFFYTAKFNVEPLKRDDITLRNILIPKTISKPDFNEKDKVELITHAGILIRYNKH